MGISVARVDWYDGAGRLGVPRHPSIIQQRSEKERLVTGTVGCHDVRSKAMTVVLLVHEGPGGGLEVAWAILGLNVLHGDDQWATSIPTLECRERGCVEKKIKIKTAEPAYPYGTWSSSVW